MLNKEFGGTVMKKDIREDGQFKVTVETSSALFRFVLKKATLIWKSLVLEVDGAQWNCSILIVGTM